MTKRPLSEPEIVQLLIARCHEAGSQAAFAKTWGLSPAYVSDVCNKRRPVSSAVAELLGYRRELSYAPQDKKNPPNLGRGG